MTKEHLMGMDKTRKLSANSSLGSLQVSQDGHFLMYTDGTPFFYLGDTAWELFHRLNREEAEHYLENRQEKQFTVIQAVVLAELDGLNTPNVYGHTPLMDNDPARPNDAYFQYVDEVVRMAGARGLYVGMLPVWGDKFHCGKGPYIFSPGYGNQGLEQVKDKIYRYGRYLGERYKNTPNLIWILGGDIDPDGRVDIWRELARGVKEGDEGKHLITYHPCGGSRSSSFLLHNESWLDFNMYQSGHARLDLKNYLEISGDYGLVPAKPTLDGEPRYEDMPVGMKEGQGRFGAFDVRQAAYWSLFAGACGFTYGCNNVWQMYTKERISLFGARTAWFDSLDLEGACQMRYVRKLIEARPFYSRIPDMSVLADEQEEDGCYAMACRDQEGSYAFVYTPAGKPVHVCMHKVRADRINASWYDPRTGRFEPIGKYSASGVRKFAPPSQGRGNDWVLVLDDASKSYSIE